MGGGGSEEAASESSESPAPAVATTGEEGATLSVTTTTEAAEGATVTAPEPGALAAVVGPPPPPVTAAFRSGDTVVLLFVKDGGIDDRLVTRSVDRLKNLSHVATFVVPAARNRPLHDDQPGGRGEPDPRPRGRPPKAPRPVPSPAPRCSTGSKARPASNRRSSMPDTRARPSTTTPEVSMEPRDLPGHLRPVPDSGDSTALRSSRPRFAPEETPPVEEAPARWRRSRRRRGDHRTGRDPPAREATRSDARRAGNHTGPDPAGLARALDRVRHRRPGRTRVRHRGAGAAGDRRGAHGRASAGAPAPRAGGDPADQLSRAVAERYGLDHVDLSLFQVDMAAANLISVSSARRYTAPFRSDSPTRRRCSSRPRTRPTCSRSTTSKWRPGSTAPSRSPPGRHRGADRPPQHSPERRQRGDHRGGGGGRGRRAG